MPTVVKVVRSCVRGMVFAAAAACAGASNTVFIAPTSETVRSDTDVIRANPPTHVIRISNRSSVPITVWNISLEPCENVRASCSPRKTDIKVPPGGSVVAIRIEPVNENRGFTYHFRWAWRPDSSVGRAAAMAITGANPALARELSPTDFRQFGPRIVKIKPSEDSVLLEPGETFDLYRVKALLLDAQDSIVGFTRFASVRLLPTAALAVNGPSVVYKAVRPGRTTLQIVLASQAQQLLATPVSDLDVPIIVAYRFAEDAPTIGGRVLDSTSKTPLACARVAVEDGADVVVGAMRSDPLGAFAIRVPTAGAAYRVRVDVEGWRAWQSEPARPGANATLSADHFVNFSEQSLVRPSAGNADFEPARPTAIRFEPSSERPSTANTPVIFGVTLLGSPTLPILNILSPLPPQTLAAQFLVDTTGKADTTSLLLANTTAPRVRATVRYVLPRVRFAPAKEMGKVTCDLLRMQVNITPR